MNYLKYFELDSFFVADSKSLKNNTQHVLEDIYKFINIPPDDLSTRKFDNYHVRKYNNKLDDEIKSLLYKFYKPYNEKLFSLLGERYDWDIYQE